MANQEIAVNTETLALDIAELNTTLETARKMLRDMFTQIQELDAMWDGPANDEFNKIGRASCRERVCEYV